MVQIIGEDGNMETLTASILERGLLETPNGVAQKHCVAWLFQFLSLVGDKDPTSENVHLEQQYKTEIYNEYVQAMDYEGGSL